jgi:hypothetical protein
MFITRDEFEKQLFPVEKLAFFIPFISGNMEISRDWY